MSTEIPLAKGLPFIGNLLDLQDEVPLRAIERLVDVYGPIVKFSVLGRERIVVGSFELFDELCDETRFYKLLGGALAEAADMPDAPPQGLFTQKTEKTEDWQQAHRILMPAFGALAIEEMFDEMHDIASQLVLKWARQGPEHRILATDDFSRLTLDTIALCAMDYRFNSFYQEDMHPFVKSMNNVLNERNESGQISGMIKRLIPSHNEQLKKDVEHQKAVSYELVNYRRAHPTEKKDLLNALIYGKDPKTGASMRDGLIISNMQTFLIAGHETTSGLLSFAFMLMLKNPSTWFEAQKEVDRVIGKDKIGPGHLKDLKYINAVLRETLRLCPTAPAFSRAVRPENKEEFPTIGGGKYAIPRDKTVMCLLAKIQQDPKVWGDDAAEFKPERMMDGKFENLPKNAWKPFGTGLRGCIGRAFAWQEALLAVALILQNFNVKLDDPNYEVKVVQTLTIKPKDLYLRASLRPGVTATALQHRLISSKLSDETKKMVDKPHSEGDVSGGLTILYGSNTGTCQALAQNLASQAAQRGLKATVGDLDTAIDKLPTRQPLVVISASYEGEPPDNAARFVAWLESLGETKRLEGVKYAVFGCGHSDWASTYQRVPNLIDALITKAGGERQAERGSLDVSKGDAMGAFCSWTDSKLWPVMSTVLNAPAVKTLHSPIIPTIELNISHGERASHLQQNVQWAKVNSADSLTTDSQDKRHISFQLPTGTSYTTGDYLAILPLNPEDTVKKVIKQFQLPFDGTVTIKRSGPTTLPTGKPISIFDLLSGYVEISLPANRQDVELLTSVAQNPSEKEQLQAMLTQDAFQNRVVQRRITILDLLERYPSATVPFPQYLALLPPLRPRYYSISSSPLANPECCTLTYSVIDAPSWSSDGRFLGVAGTYLRNLKPGDQALVAVRSTNKYFRLPADSETTPIVMFCAGSGIAPFRGFVQERSVLMKEGGRKLAPALLFVGCRSPKSDRLYGDELDEWARLGAVDVRYAYSKDPAASEGCKYVQDRLLRDKEDVLDMWYRGARFYVCGGRMMAEGISAASSQLVAEAAKKAGKDLTEEDIVEFKQKMKNERFLSDIFD